jgi:transposase
VPSVNDCSRTAPPPAPSGVAGIRRNHWLASVGITGWNESESPAGLRRNTQSKQHDISRQLIRIWVGKFEAGALDEDVQAADLIQEYEAKIAALERLVGRQALELELLKGALKHAPRPKSASTSVVIGPVGSPSAGGAS